MIFSFLSQLCSENRFRGWTKIQREKETDEANRRSARKVGTIENLRALRAIRDHFFPITLYWPCSESFLSQEANIFLRIFAEDADLVPQPNSDFVLRDVFFIPPMLPVNLFLVSFLAGRSQRALLFSST